MSLFRRRALIRENQRLAQENEALRTALTDLGRQLHGTQTAPCGDTVPLPRVRSATPSWPLKEWTL